MPALRASQVRFWAESILASVTGLSGLLTVVWRDWIEVFGWEPDGGSGLLEWRIAGALLAAALVLGASARVHWRRLDAAVPV